MQPILLLKTRTQPEDPYETLLLSQSSPSYIPYFLPVLTHTLLPAALTHLRNIFSSRKAFAAEYDSIILTSQRAVEALDAALLSSSNLDVTWPSAASITETSPSSIPIPIFVVGPATQSSVAALIAKYFRAQTFTISGQESGNGEALVEHILDYPSSTGKRALFPTGEKRRDTVPRLLRAAGWSVEEVPCYETVTREEFAGELEDRLGVLRREVVTREVWVVVFSPQGCRELLAGCGWIDVEGERVREEVRGWEGREAAATSGGDEDGIWIRVMSIGPTTKAFLEEEFGFCVDAVAAAPSAAGILQVLENTRTG